MLSFANTQVAAGQLDDLTVGGAVRDALLEAALDGGAATAGEFYAVMNDGTDSAIFRVAYDSDIGGAANVLDFSADILDIEEVARFDDFANFDSGDFV